MHIASIAAQLRVTNLQRALDFYVSTLGFREDFRFQDFYAGVSAGAHAIHLKQVESTDPSIPFVSRGDHLHLYLRVADLDAAFRELQGKADLVYPITTKPWGDREFTIRDPDGHTIYIAQADSD
jgi:catechol 2,3-dioxygenase-like lactoylglutathione lyase family enzyme